MFVMEADREPQNDESFLAIEVGESEESDQSGKSDAEARVASLFSCLFLAGARS